MTYTLDITPAQFQALVGLLDQAIKVIGIRAFEDDVAGLMQAVKVCAATDQAQPVDEAA